MHTDWQFFLRAADAWEAMIAAARSAEREILCEQYIIGNDEVGRSFLGVLMERARAGVEVRVIVDMVGAAISGLYFDAALVQEVRESGVKLIFFNPIRLWRIDTVFSWFFRTHRKIMVVDDVGFVGGVGFRADMREWRDTHLKVAGPVVEEMRHAFFEMEALSREKKFLRRLRRHKFFARGFEFVTNSPSLRKRFIYQRLAHAFAGARSRILITTPYFVPDKRMIRILRLAVLRGVRVEILLPEQSNHRWVDRAGRRFYGLLLEAGMHLYTYEDRMLHAKTFVVDDEFASVGSFNFDSLSFNLNYEGNVASHQPLFVEQVAAYFEEDKRGAAELTLAEWRKRPAHEKFLEWLTVFFRRLL